MVKGFGVALLVVFCCLSSLVKAQECDDSELEYATTHNVKLSLEQRDFEVLRDLMTDPIKVQLELLS